ncbi:chymotrypsin-like protease CTRL-1 [Garra rufa]|uniref:chymotrypsin-like protease CTRL-1 n=1 Tax=Garra rufa TaxID=137080 RepID=UPI003CCE6D86
MIWIIGFLALVASTLGCGVRQAIVHYPEHSIAKRYISLDEKDLSEDLLEHLDSYVWPWQVSIQTSSGELICGGSLIDKNWVLTAAHCLVEPTHHYVVLGQNDRASNNGFVQVKNISKVITHPDFNEQTMRNDIALLKLSSPVQMTSRISPICLPSFFTVIYPWKSCVITGWGVTKTEWISQILQEATVPIVSQTRCRRVWGMNNITDAMICAGASGASSCQGDSGGPLMCERSGVWYQVGIVSWGDADCVKDRPVIYTRVSYFQNWISEIITSE